MGSNPGYLVKSVLPYIFLIKNAYILGIADACRIQLRGPRFEFNLFDHFRLNTRCDILEILSLVVLQLAPIILSNFVIAISNRKWKHQTHLQKISTYISPSESVNHLHFVVNLILTYLVLSEMDGAAKVSCR